MTDDSTEPVEVLRPAAETADASRLRQSHFAAGYDAGKSLLEAKAEYLEARLTWNAGEVDRLRAIIHKHYPTIAGHVMRLQDAHEDRAAAEWTAVAQDFAAALEARS